MKFVLIKPDLLLNRETKQRFVPEYGKSLLTRDAWKRSIRIIEKDNHLIVMHRFRDVQILDLPDEIWVQMK